MLKIVGYARVSSREQANESHALEQQVARLKAAGATEILTDIDSGSKSNRPNFRKLLGMVQRDEIQEVVITRIDRLTRELKTVLEIRDVFINSSVNLRALDDTIDLSTPGGKFHLSLLGSLAEMEVNRLSERVKHGWQDMRNNKRIAVAPFGYKVVDGALKLDKQPLFCLLEDRVTYTPVDVALDTVEFFFQAKTLRGTVTLFNQKYGVQRFNNGRGRFTWRRLGWSHTGLRDWLTNPTLLGHTFYPKKRGRSTQGAKKDWKIYYDTHEPLITPEQSYEITQILENNKQVRGYGTNKRRHATAGLVYCAKCRGSCYSLAGTRGKTPGYNYYFQCRYYRTKSCDQKKTVRVEKINKALIEALTQKHAEIATKAENIPAPINKSKEDIKLLQQQLKGLEGLGFNPALDQARREIERQIQSLKKNDGIYKSQTENKHELLKYIFSLPDFWENQNLEDLTRIYRELVSEIFVLEGEVQSVHLKI